MPYIANSKNLAAAIIMYQSKGRSKGKFPMGVESQECVALVKMLTGAPHTSIWRRGMNVWKMRASLEPGTAIANFKEVKGHPGQFRFPNQRGFHATIFLEATTDGIRVLEQYRGQPPRVSVIEATGPCTKTRRPLRNAQCYFVIEELQFRSQ